MSICAKCLTAQATLNTGSKHGGAGVVTAMKRPTAANKHGRPCLSALPGMCPPWASATPTVRWAAGLCTVLGLL